MSVLDRTDDEALTETAANPPCQGCSGACCRSYVVPVTGYDVWRISTVERLAPESYLIAGHQQGTDNPEGFMLNPDGKPFFLALDKKGRFYRYAPCVFLMFLATGEQKCGIYPHRPAACRGYPMTMTRGRVHVSDHNICPPNSWPQEEIDRPNWRSAVKRTYMESDIYSEVVARWNAMVAHSGGQSFTLNEYLSFVMNVHGRLLRLEEELGADEMARIEATWPTPPRAAGNLEEIRVCRGDFPWLDFLLRARAEIDRFYPAIPPQPAAFPLPWDQTPTS